MAQAWGRTIGKTDQARRNRAERDPHSDHTSGLPELVRPYTGCPDFAVFSTPFYSGKAPVWMVSNVVPIGLRDAGKYIFVDTQH